MKKLKLLFLTLASVGVLGLQSCGDDEANPKPSVTFKSGTGYTSGNVTKATGTTITLGIIATGEVTLKEVKVTLSTGGSPSIVFDSTFSEKQFSHDLDLTLGSNPGTETYTVQVTDKNGETAESSVTITLVQNKPLAERILDFIGQTATAPANCWNADLNEMLELADAKPVSAQVDVIYFFGATNKATVSAPDNLSDLNQIYTSSPDAPSTWATRNATRFRKTTMTSAQFDAVDIATNEAVLTEYNAAPPSANKANMLAAGEVYLFETKPGQSGARKGLMKISSVPTTSGGTLNVVVKYEN